MFLIFIICSNIIMSKPSPLALRLICGTNMAKILIAEDERDIRDLITFTLTFAGYQVVAASNGEEALNLARQEIPDLILMDVRMPRMTGYEACTAMKADPKLKDIPVIFLSAKGQDSEIQIGMQAGAVEYLLKPFAPDQLTARIQAILTQFGK
jgi:CheY-like chemotaxis protein